jgi:protein TonB
MVTAFAAAALIHISAVAFGFHHQAPRATLEAGPAEVDVFDPLPVEETTPPPVEPVPEPVPAAAESDFVEAPALPRRVVKDYRPGPIRPPRVGGVSNWHGKTNMISAPRPEYPYEARSRHLTGSGVIVVSVDPASGFVINTRIERSIGSPILDSSAVTAFKRWRFKPGSAPQVRIPVTFDLNGAVY